MAPRWRSIGIGLMAVAVVLGARGAASAGQGSSIPVVEPTSSAAQIANATNTVSGTTEVVSGTTEEATNTVTQTTEEANNTVTQTTEEANNTVTQTTEEATDTVTQATDDVAGTVTQTTDDVAGTVTQTTDDVTDTVTQTTDDAAGTVTQATDDAGSTASGTIGGVSDAVNHTIDKQTGAHSDNDGSATSGPREVRGDGANAVDVIPGDARTGWRAGGSPSGDGPLVGRRYFAPASLALAAANVRELASLSVLNLGGCNLHRGGDPIPCAEDVPMGDGVLGIVLGTTGIAVLTLLALAAFLAASGTTSFVVGRIRQA